jgi:hypothetical protein
MAALVAFLRRVGDARRRRRIPKPRVFRDRFNPLDQRTDDELFERCRFRRPTIIFLCGLIKDVIIHPTKRSLALPPIMQLLVFLRFIATGAFHQLIGDSMHISKADGWKVYPEGSLSLCWSCRPIHCFPYRSGGYKHQEEISHNCR